MLPASSAINLPTNTQQEFHPRSLNQISQVFASRKRIRPFLVSAPCLLPCLGTNPPGTVTYKLKEKLFSLLTGAERVKREAVTMQVLHKHLQAPSAWAHARGFILAPRQLSPAAGTLLPWGRAEQRVRVQVLQHCCTRLPTLPSAPI